MKFFALTILTIVAFEASAQTPPTRIPEWVDQTRLAAFRELEVIYSNGQQNLFCGAEIKEPGMISANSMFDSRNPRWIPAGAATIHRSSETMKQWIAEIAKSKTTVTEVQNAIASEYYAIIDRSTNPPTEIPVFGRGKKSVTTNLAPERVRLFVDYIKNTVCRPY